MPQNSRYIVAKYVPDMRRMEPHNIGLFVWVDGRVVMRFLKEKDTPFIDDQKNYQRWRDYWRGEIAKDSIAPIRGPAVSKKEPEFMDVLRKTQEGNYLLSDGGRFSQPIGAAEIDDAANFLFRELIAPHRQKQESENEKLAAVAEKALSESGLRERETFRTHYHVKCPIYGVETPITLNYAIASEDEGNPDSVLHRVSVRSSQSTISTATNFHSLLEARKVRGKKHCVSLIDSREASPRAASALKLLRRVSTVVDVSDLKKAIEQLKRLDAAA